MKKGIAYAGSREERLLDLGVSLALSTVSLPLRATAIAYMHRAGLWEHASIFTQQRTGKDGAEFDIFKLRTLNPGTEEPISALARVIRKSGLDEAIQARNIRNKTMSAVGWRPLKVAEHEEAMDLMSPKHQKMQAEVVRHTLPGAVSSFATYCHLNPNPDPSLHDRRAEMNYRDFIVEGSLMHDIELLSEMAIMAVRHGSR